MSQIDRIQYQLNLTYIKNNYVFDNEFKNEYDNYIIFHTKARFDYCAASFKSTEHILINFFKNFKTNYTILILGEKYVEQNDVTCWQVILKINLRSERPN